MVLDVVYDLGRLKVNRIQNLLPMRDLKTQGEGEGLTRVQPTPSDMDIISQTGMYMYVCTLYC